MDKHLKTKKITVSLFILILINISLGILNNKYDLYILYGDINQTTINSIVNSLIIILFILLLNNCIKSKLKYIINFFLIAYFLLALLFTSVSNSDKKYFYFNSPNNSNILIIEEDAFLLGGWSNFYERKGLIFIKDLKTRINTDDGYRPFSTNCYRINWSDSNTVELYYDF